MLLFSLACALTLGRLAAEPGGEAVLQVENRTARLYLAEVHRGRGGAVSALRLAWIPVDIEERCLGKGFGHCGDADHCVVWGRENPDGCAKAGLRQGELPRRRAKAVPTRLLDLLLTDARVKDLALRWGLEAGAEGVQKPLLERARSVRTRVRWELWTNGEGFALKSLLRD